MRIVFMGTPEIALPPLTALIEAGFDIPLVISQPDKPKGRGNVLTPTPVKQLAVKYGIEVFQPTAIRNNPEVETLLKSIKADFFAVAAYGKILPPSILTIPKKAPINLHFSLLPAYRGAAPVNWAILNGDEYTGVTSMKMDEGMDTGDILLTEKALINNSDALSLGEELAVRGGKLLVKTFLEYESIIARAQSGAASAAPMITKEMGRIDWRREAAFIERMSRAFLPWPSAYTHHNGKLLKIFSAQVIDEKAAAASGGEVVSVGKTSFDVSTALGILRVNEVQLEGKRRLPVRDFLAGYSLKVGDRFD
ncbi:MAG: methionyl-tRNA formyltransferase [Deferribacteraceae bacterium]|jgi:methionyl-tRNA formyltransferase|nr:methionyl-tRNA formyltransferase [Deferribacteraceae bacterium]